MKKTCYICFLILFIRGISFNAQTNFCTNADFESSVAGSYTTANAISGWTISSQAATSCSTSTLWTSGSSEFSLVSTPVTIPIVGLLGTSPLGGTNIAVLNNTIANANRTKLAQTVTVSAGSAVFQFAYAGVWQAGSHTCCEQAGFKVQIKDCSGTILSCPSFSMGAGNCTNPVTYSVQNGITYTNWMSQQLDLSAYSGSCVTIEIIASDCVYGDHYGTLYFDAKCMGYGTVANATPVPFCPGASSVALNAPLGFQEYLWAAPTGYSISPAQASLVTLNVNTPVAGNVFTVYIKTNVFDCPAPASYILQTNTLAIQAIGASSSCANGASGSATVIASMSSSSLIYEWSTPTGAVVGTASVVNGLPPGVYNISISAVNSGSCGVATSTVLIGAAPNTVILSATPFCGNEAYLNTPSGSSNFQWYTGTVAIPASLGGTAPGYTINNPANGAIYTVTYHSLEGCNDSVRTVLYPIVAGTVNIARNIICPGSSNGQVTISINPASSGTTGTYFSLSSNGLPTPTYSISAGPVSASGFTAGNLTANGIYNVTVLDGICHYQQTFTMSPLTPFDYTLSPATATLCLGQGIIASALFNPPPLYAQYTYSWSPPAGLIAGSVFSMAIIAPTTATNTGITTLVYSLAVTPTAANCPVIKTLSLTILPPVIATIAPIPTLCSNSSAFTISASPPGGTFYNTFGNSTPVSPAGVLTPTTAQPGTHSVTYSGVCIANTTGTYAIIPPYITATISPSFSMCLGNNSQSMSIQPSGGVFSYNNNSGAPYVNTSGVIHPPNYLPGLNTFSYTGSCLVPVTGTYSVVAPSLSVTGNHTLCPGESFTLTALGADTYTWNNITVSPTLAVSSFSTNYYTLAGTTTNNSCYTSIAVIFTVSPVTQINITGMPVICIGQATTLHVNGTLSYTWSNNSNLSTISVTPTVTTNYHVYAYDEYGCIASASWLVQVKPLPHLSVTGHTVICAGENAHITLHGANFYRLDNLYSASIDRILAPTVTTVYQLFGADFTTGCSDTIPFTIIVTPCNGIASYTADQSLKIYPAINDGRFIIDTETPCHAFIYSTSGELLFDQELNAGKNNIDMQLFQGGIYFIRVTNAGAGRLKKIIKQ